MGTKKEIRFRGRLFAGYEEMVRVWHKAHPSEFPVTPGTVASNLQKWKKKNPGKNIPDDVIERYLTSRKAKNTLFYKKKRYGGPKELYQALLRSSQVSYATFHLNLMNWIKRNPDRSLSDSDIEELYEYQRVKLDDGRKISPSRHVWERLPSPKISWSNLQKKLTRYKRETGNNPTDKEIEEFSLPEREWLEDYKAGEYRNVAGRQITSDKFYQHQNIEKVEFGTWRKRIRAHQQRTSRRPTIAEAIELLRPWGIADRSKGILYRWTNKRDGKVYIGITTETLEERTRGHQRTVKSGDYSLGGLHEAIKHEGIDAFLIEIIGELDDLADLASAEKKAIERHGCLYPFGYNLVSGGKGISLRKVPITFRGESYKNLKSLADDYEMPVKRLESRLRLGWTLEHAVDIPKGFQKDKPFHEKSAENIRELASRNGLRTQTVYARLSAGWSLDEALGIKTKQRVGGNAKLVEVNGESFLSHRRAAKYYGIPEGTWRKRLRLGWNIEEVAGLKSPPKK